MPRVAILAGCGSILEDGAWLRQQSMATVLEADERKGGTVKMARRVLEKLLPEWKPAIADQHWVGGPKRCKETAHCAGPCLRDW